MAFAWGNFKIHFDGNRAAKLQCFEQPRDGCARGKFALVARFRDEAGAITPIEFSEMWENPDAEEYVFFADYPIGDNVLLESVRVRNLMCTCEGAWE